MEKYLKKIYFKFLNFDRKYFIIDAKKWSTSLKGLKISDKTIGQFYDSYSKIPFLTFLKHVKDIIYSKNAFDFILKNSSEDWKLWDYLEVLTKEKIIKVNKGGKVYLFKKEILKIIPKPQRETEIKEKIKKKLKVNIKEKDSVVNLFQKFKDFTVKGKWDQMPISQGSAIFVVKKILDNLPLNKKFLFVGDDDFISVILSIADPSIESLVIDADEQLLECINFLAQKFRLKIKTKKVDIRKERKLGDKFVGFLANPVYTEAGIKEFVKYGVNQLDDRGGWVFLEIGDESIGNRFLFLQEFFARNNLIIREVIPNKIFYPYIELYKEDKEILRRMAKMINEKVIKKSPRIGSSLYIFHRLPQKPKRVKFKKPFYAYL